ncbi:hypothetical protein FRB96_006336 [Tulasnella sp. 330]|nr:hypothetical protein FRB96_006336 [Tulasnella sp. 330]KAG8884242.1 hypothetical protein FRB97_004747 [Tulasnella sp. 331]KAG8889392.1 hypothetical protein FRB98_004485 [Tulasnella sp. 332]
MSAMTETPSYKKARRHFLKTRQKPETDNSDLTAFRVQEKKYKSKFPPPLLDNVLDHWVLDQKLGELGGGWCNGGNQLSGETVSSIELEKVGEGSTEGKAYLISSHPGAVLAFKLP